MRKQFFYAMASLFVCLALLSSCEGLSSYSTFYTYSWNVAGPSVPSNADKLEAYLIELGAPAKEGKLNDAMVQIQGVSEADCNQRAIRQFNEVVSKIDYAKVKEMGVSIQHIFTYSLRDAHYNAIAEWKYPNEQANIDTVVTHSLLSIRMVFGADLPKYCDAELLLNGEVVKTLAEGDTVYEADFKVTKFPQDLLYSSHFTKRVTPTDTIGLHLGARYYYLLTNRNAANEVVSSSEVYAAEQGVAWGTYTGSVSSIKLDNWLEKYGNRSIVLFHIDGKNTVHQKPAE